jgi:hypothetical protein
VRGTRGSQIALAARGVRFLEAPGHEPYGTVAVFVDLHGNKLDPIERRAPGEAIELDALVTAFRGATLLANRDRQKFPRKHRK